MFTDPTQFSRFDLIVAVYAYAIQIYADFSAYTDIAIGVAALLGYRFPQNFNQPYRALGIGDFWRRWHMTLSRWLRDYLYIPLGGNRHGALATARNLMLTMLLGGLWHGANWTFLIWGAMHGVALVADHAWRRSAAFARFGGGPIARVVDWALTFHFVCFAWLFFRSPSLDAATAIPRGRVDRQRRAEHHADDRSAADRLRRADADRPVADARRDRRRARQSRPGDPGRVRLCAALFHRRDGAVGFGAVHLFPVLRKALVTAHPPRPASSTSPWSWALVIYFVFALVVFCFPGGLVDWLDERNASGWLDGAAGDRAGDRRGFGRGRREGRGAGAAQMVRAGGGGVGYLKERAGRRLGRPRFSLLLGYPFPNTSLFMIFLECFYSV